MPRVGSLSAIALRFSISAIFLGPVLAPPERDFGGSFPESAPPIALETRAKLATNQNEFTRLRQFFFCSSFEFRLGFVSFSFVLVGCFAHAGFGATTLKTNFT